MPIALDLARLGAGRTSPNPAVGAVIVKKGKILATGFHKGPGLPHAEAEAIGKFRIPNPKLQGATLYVTLEPCCPGKNGRTPPCTDAIIRSGIREVVVGMKDPDRHARGRGIALLRRAGIRVRTGVLENECHEFNAAYIVHRTRRRPYVILKMAMTLEGYVGWKGRGRLTSALQVTGREAQRHAHMIRDQVDAILVGVGTVIADDPRLTTRLIGKGGKDPVRVILDPLGKTPPDARVLNLRSYAKTIIASAPLDRHGRIDLTRLLRRLAEQGIVTLLVEGGPEVWRSFLRKRLVDRLLLFLGTGRSRRIDRDRAVLAPLHELPLSFRRLEALPLGRDLLISAVL